MRGRVTLAAIALCGAIATPARAGDEPARAFCSDRPGLGTPACTLDPGRFQLELGLGDWTRDRDAGSRTDTVAAGDVLLRWGAGDHTEIQLGWTAFGHVNVRSGGLSADESSVGDVTIAVRRNLRNPDGSGTSLAVMPYVTLPTGGDAIGAGDVGVGLLAPMAFDPGGAISFALTPSVAAAVDEDRNGRHLAYGGVVGLGFSLSDAVGASLEAAVVRDNDPAGHSTEALAGVSLGWMASPDLQVDMGTNLGLNNASNDVQLYVGLSRRF
ncbi:transporter [Hephaestia sp. GCM10023244]|uniref:transporter n=1 Tax=unclassified Hephaestia TaxID=2631281 RepID=UPI002076EADC|nr:transporter [Hephaestia sp. MAHUQ-44]MCM8730095.1 transporter [Hephaestia sp. MAHUQ-44]